MKLKIKLPENYESEADYLCHYYYGRDAKYKDYGAFFIFSQAIEEYFEYGECRKYNVVEDEVCTVVKTINLRDDLCDKITKMMLEDDCSLSVAYWTIVESTYNMALSIGISGREACKEWLEGSDEGKKQKAYPPYFGMMDISKLESSEKFIDTIIGERTSDIESLAETIKEYGIIEPIRVQREVHYKITSGFRRWEAAKMAGLNEVPVLIEGEE